LKLKCTKFDFGSTPDRIGQNATYEEKEEKGYRKGRGGKVEMTEEKKRKEGEWREKEREEPALPIKKSFPHPCM